MALKILLVDDDDLALFLHKKMMTKCNVSTDVVGFSDGKSILDHLIQNEEIKDEYLIFLDINMPVMDGWEFLKTIQNKSYAENLKVLIVTSSIDSKDRKRAGRFPQVIEFIEKPLNQESCEKLKTLPEVAPFFD